MNFTDRVAGKKILLAGILSAGLLIVTVCSFAAGIPTHLDRAKNPQGCSACHRGHGSRGTFMLPSPREDLCFTCHGTQGAPGQVSSSLNMESVFNKRSKHPVQETSMFHFSTEELPEQDPATPRHVACADCHRIHVLEKEDKLRGIKGHVPGKGYALGLTRQAERARNEYEVCYKCHSESRNLPSGKKDVAEEFIASNPSFHPVEASGRNKNVPSLIGPLTVNSTITCSDCHGNDDPFGPRGPHGSNVENLLKMMYTTVEGVETRESYELCYSCHERDSILGNDSFKKHQEHIVFNRIPCAACHTPHGSNLNQNLIEFDALFVDPSPQPLYTATSPGRPLCMLNCHVGGLSVPHDDEFYKTKQWP